MISNGQSLKMLLYDAQNFVVSTIESIWKFFEEFLNLFEFRRGKLDHSPSNCYPSGKSQKCSRNTDVHENWWKISQFESACL